MGLRLRDKQIHSLTVLFLQDSWFKHATGCGASAGEAEEDPGGAGGSDLWRKPFRHLCGESG